ncbi:MAG: glycosyltransferase family 2 protein [Candidatus Omnitrophica bacterium]|jgi:glycosyltransferase involved in cell wall biosynthesis|nr:glycosyltransferase family 2 protein [Candidatus Omnitrophota bacterium]
MISVIIVTYNRKFLLKECLDSLLNQDYGEKVEIIIVDNFSSDGTSGFIKDEFGEKAKLITNLTKLTLADCKNRGIRLATGNIIAFTDDDCVVSKGWLSSIKESLLTHDISGGVVLSAPGVEFPWWWRSSLNWLVGLSSKQDHDFFPLGSNIAFKRHVFKNMEEFGSDVTISEGECQQYGEDNYRLRKALGAGFVMTTSSGMVVYHHVPLGRLRILYLIQRSYLEGKTWAKREPSFSIFIFRSVACVVCPVRLLVTWDLNHFFRMIVSAAYVFTFIKIKFKL